MEKSINIYKCSKGHETVTKDVDDGTTPMIMNCRHEPPCPYQSRSCFYEVNQTLDHQFEFYRPIYPDQIRDSNEREHVKAGGLLLRKKGESGKYMQPPFKERLMQSFNKKKMNYEIGVRKWHRVFGWVTVTHPSGGNGGVLVDSEHKHIEHYVGGRFITYKGENGGNITSIYMQESELFNEPQKDKIQSAMHYLVKVIE